VVINRNNKVKNKKKALVILDIVLFLIKIYKLAVDGWIKLIGDSMIPIAVFHLSKALIVVYHLKIVITKQTKIKIH
jgi:hypothetical protein